MNIKLFVTIVSNPAQAQEREITVRYNGDIDAAMSAAVKRIYGRKSSFIPAHGMRGPGYSYGDVVRPTYIGRGQFRQINGYAVGQRLLFCWELV